jgi:ribosomal protein S18 acetylase RimI-like enzyme
VTSPLIRACLVEEARSVLDLWRRAEATVSVTDNLESVVALIEGWPGALIVASDGDTIVGSIIATFDGWRGNLYRLVVDPSCRRRGIATALVAAAEAQLRGRGAKRIAALVESDHPLATGFWEAGSYTRNDVMRRYYRGLD